LPMYILACRVIIHSSTFGFNMYEILHSDINTAISYGQEPKVLIKGPVGVKELYLDSVDGDSVTLRGLVSAYQQAQDAYDEAESESEDEQFQAGDVLLHFLDSLDKDQISELYQAA